MRLVPSSTPRPLPPSCRNEIVVSERVDEAGFKGIAKTREKQHVYRAGAAESGAVQPHNHLQAAASESNSGHASLERIVAAWPRLSDSVKAESGQRSSRPIAEHP